MKDVGHASELQLGVCTCFHTCSSFLPSCMCCLKGCQTNMQQDFFYVNSLNIWKESCVLLLSWYGIHVHSLTETTLVWFDTVV